LKRAYTNWRGQTTDDNWKQVEACARAIRNMEMTDE